MEIREVKKDDLEGLLHLYTQLHDNPVPVLDGTINALWQEITDDKNHHIIVGIEQYKIVCSCVLVIVPNLTHDQRPYGLIENVVTDENYRKRGYASAILNYAKEIAQGKNCYKIMLLTGSKQENTLKFYEKAGYNRQDKTAFIMWL